MSENRDAFEFLSKCWVPFISPEHSVYYASGNTRMHDFLRDFKVNRDMDILVLGLGDIRHVMATVAGLSKRPQSSAGKVKEIRFHLNDVDQDVIARDAILLEVMNKLDPKSKSDAGFLWSVWYNAFMVEKDFIRLKDLLVDLIDKYSNSSRDSERICKFGDNQSLKSVLKTWNCWLNRKLDQSSVKRSRLKSFEDKGYTMSFNDDTISQYASMQIYTDRGIKESDVKIVGKEMLATTIDGFVNFSDDRKGRKVFANPTMMRPGCDEWRVEDGAHAAACYIPFQKEFLDRHSTIHEACFEKMREAIFSYVESWKVTKVTYTFWATDMFHLCHWLLPSDVTFDFIFTSNLMDHVGLLNLLIITQPRLKNSQSVLLTESHNWNEIYETLEEFFDKELKCNLMLLPSMIGLRLAEDLTLGTSNLQGFYRTMYGRHSDTESFYWTKSLNQENFLIDFEGSHETKKAISQLLLSTFWNKLTTTAASSIRQTPLALMYCFQRLQHLFRGGMTELLEYVEFVINERSWDFARNRITWDIVSWAFGLKHERDQLYIVKIPMKDVTSRLTAMKKYCNLNCRLRLDYNNSWNTEEVLSLFQYDAIGQHFEVPILESAWNALSKDSTISVINNVSDKSPSLPPGLGNEKFPVKILGKVTATYNQPKQTDAAKTNSSALALTCFEDVDKYRLPKTLETKGIAQFDLMCKLIVSGYQNNLGLESTTPFKFSCAVDSYEIKDVDANRTEAILYKMKNYNTGRTALPFRLIADCELLPFANGREIKNYLEETMICDLMFCSPADIESRAKAFRGRDLLTDDAFLVLRLVIEHLWQIGSQKDKTPRHTLQMEIREPGETAEVLNLDIEGYYKYNGLPLVRMRYMELDRNSAALNTSQETTTTIYAKDRKCLRLLKKMLFTNSLRMSQERSASVTMTSSTSQSLNTFLQMVFLKESGEDMALALHEYPANTGSVRSYVDKIYSASIRKNFVSRVKAMRMMNKQMNEWMSSILSKKVDQIPSGRHMPDAKMTKNASSSPLKQQTECAECKKPTTDLKKCSRCMSITYCSKECQVKHWPNHKKICSSTKLKAENGSTAAKEISDESGCSRKPKKTSGSLMQPRMEECATKESGLKDASSINKIENDPLIEMKIKDCSSERSNNEGSSTVTPMSKDNIEDGSEISSSIKAESKSQTHLQDAQSNDGNAVVTDNSVCPKSVELCMHCRLEKTNMKKCTKCKSAAYCSQECQRADWKRHKLECQTQEFPSALQLMSHCNSCGVLGEEMKRCSQCKNVSYCSFECQRKDWKSHKTNCRRP